MQGYANWLIERDETIVESFFEKVYKIVAKIPKGKVATYGQLAILIGRPGSARTVGWAMRGAKEELHLPCHRVVNRFGEMAPGDTFGAPEIQRNILISEGITFKDNGLIDMKKHLWNGEG